MSRRADLGGIFHRWWAATLMLVCTYSLAAGQDTTDERFLAGLRARRLYSLAETYCQRRLLEATLPERERGTLTLEWLRTLSEHAVQSLPDQRAPLWRQAEEVAEQFEAQHAGHPLRMLVRAQLALSRVVRGELARLEAEIAPQADRAQEDAREVLRQALRFLEELDGELTREIPRRRRDPVKSEELTAVELTSLQYHLRFQTARVYRNQALCYPDRSADRVASLTRSLGLLEGLSQVVPSDDELSPQLRLDLAIGQRLLRDLPAALAALQALESEKLPAPLRAQVRAEIVRLHLTNRKTGLALAALEAGEPVAGGTSAELDFAHLETYVALWQAASEAKQPDEATKWREKSIQTVKFVELTHGPYWGRRADALLVRVGSERGEGGIEILRRAADDLYLKGRFDEAVAAYEQAAAKAEHDPRTAFELAYKAALVQQQRQLYDDAGRRFRELALRMPSRPEAANAHLLAVVNEAQACKAEPGRLDGYVAWLDEHLSLWPYAATSNQARLWLGKIREQRQEWPAAIAAYQGVLRDADTFFEALLGAERCWTASLTAQSAKGTPVEQAAQQAADWFAQGLVDGNGTLPSTWNGVARQCVLAAARLRLLFTSGQRPETERMLRAALAGMPPPSEPWAAAARALLVIAVAGQANRVDEAKQLLTEMRDAAPEQLLEVARSISVLRSDTGGDGQHALAKLQLLACESIGPFREKLNAAAQIEFDRLRAEALAATGDPTAAAAAYSELLKQLPQRTDIRLEFAQWLLTSGDRVLTQKALEQWRILASIAPPRSGIWFQAKHGVARAQLKLGDKAGAAKLVRYLQATENLAASGWSERFAELLKQCEPPP